MAWPWIYAIRIEGLQGLSVLFLPNARSDNEARDSIALCDRFDTRRQTKALYRIECVIDELADKDSEPLPLVRGRLTRGVFILTGKLQKKLHDDVFAAESAHAATSIARRRNWTNIRLYQCAEVPLK